MSYYFSFSAPSLIKRLQSQLSPQDCQKLYSEQKAHATMLYVYGQYERELESVYAPNIEARITDIQVWQSDSKEGFSYLVATLESPQLHDLHKRLQEEINYIDPRNNFKPHISLQKNKDKSQLVDPTLLSFLIGQSVMLENFHCRDIGDKNETISTPNTSLDLNQNLRGATAQFEILPLTPEEEFYFARKSTKIKN